MAEDQDLLVAEVYKYRHLYDSSCREHRDSKIISNSWREIAAALGKEEEWAKKTWKNLRDRYVKARKSTKGRSGDPGGHTHIPRILTELSWLSNFIKHRETESNFPAEEVAVEELDREVLSPSPLNAACMATVCSSGLGLSQASPSPSVCSSDLGLSQASSSPSSVSSNGSSTLDYPVEQVVGHRAPASPGEQRRASRTVWSGPPQKRRRPEDTVLERLVNLDKHKANLKETDNTRFASVMVDMLDRMPLQQRDAVKFKLFTVMHDALYPSSV